MANDTTGKVTRLYTDTDGCYIQTSGTPAPKYNYYQLLLTHPNYNALYSLALSAAVNKNKLRVRTVQEIDANQIAEVEYLLVNYPS